MSYRKRIKLIKGVHLNLSGSGVGIGFSPMRGLSFSMNKTGIYNNASLPETGLYKRSKIASFSDNQRELRSYSNHFDDTNYQITMGLDENGKIQTIIRHDDIEITDEEELRRIKRRDDVKMTISHLQYIIKEKIDDTNSEFIEVYKHTEHTLKDSTIKAKMSKLKYEPESPMPFSDPEPDDSSVRLFLEEEAKEKVSSILFWTVAKKRRQYVDSLLSETLEIQHNDWERRKHDFDQSEAERVAAVNCRNKFEYDSQMKAYETYFNGDENDVSAQIDASLSAIELPCEFSIDYDLDLASGSLKLNLDLPEIEDIPSNKASILASGMVSVKEKTKKELREDYATCVTGLAFYFAGMMFNISSKIATIEVSAYTQRMDGKIGEITDQYIYAVRFDRDTFKTLKFRNIVPYESFELFPHVMRLTKQMVFKSINSEIPNYNAAELHYPIHLSSEL